MSKRVKVTDQIEASLRKALDDQEVNASDYAIFEARFVSTEPLNKKGFFDKGRISTATLEQMAQQMNLSGSAIPLQVMHDTSKTPVGKVFAGRVLPLPNNNAELRGYFAIPNYKADLIRDVESSIIDEVSVGLLTKKASCSQCGFDYFGNNTEAMLARMNHTCPNDHTLGADGCHLVLDGMDNWSELSLVNKGAASNAKILARAKQTLSQDTLDRLAASGVPIDAFFLTASYQMSDKDNNTGVNTMDLDKLTAKLETQTAELATTKLLLSQEEAKVKTANDRVTALETEVAELKASKSVTTAELETKLAAATKQLDDAFAILKPHVSAALTASGAAESEMPTNFTSAVKAVEDKGLKLHQIIGAVKSAPTQPASASKDDEARKTAFKTN